MVIRAWQLLDYPDAVDNDIGPSVSEGGQHSGFAIEMNIGNQSFSELRGEVSSPSRFSHRAKSVKAFVGAEAPENCRAKHSRRTEYEDSLL